MGENETGQNAKGQDRYWVKWEKSEVGKGEKRMVETGKNSAKMGMGEMGLGELGINRWSLVEKLICKQS